MVGKLHRTKAVIGKVFKLVFIWCSHGARSGRAIWVTLCMAFCKSTISIQGFVPEDNEQGFQLLPSPL